MPGGRRDGTFSFLAAAAAEVLGQACATFCGGDDLAKKVFIPIRNKGKPISLCLALVSSPGPAEVRTREAVEAEYSVPYSGRPGGPAESSGAGSGPGSPFQETGRAERPRAPEPQGGRASHKPRQAPASGPLREEGAGGGGPRLPGRLPLRAGRARLIPGRGGVWAERPAGSLMEAPASRRTWVFFLLALGSAAALEMFTAGALEALNGTDVRLKCTFRSPVPVGPKLTVSWYFQSELKEPLETVLHFHHRPYPSQMGRFLGRIAWDGNVGKGDASVLLCHVSPKDNGTFQCHVKNPPDVDGVIGEIRLSVVLKRGFSEMHILVLTIGTSCAAMVVLVVVVVIWRHRRRMQPDKAKEVGRPEPLKLKEGEAERETPLLGQGGTCRS
ncbi:myelin protein zero-like protein 2 isoform X2 [Erythrolamprus reginae]|uniref:myelin protein zero-like protein 2 isoform X2 n=1 Tax=Erythrolamprus reginae TaxID=121349 RepID=UPI00396C797B